MPRFDRIQLAAEALAAFASGEAAPAANGATGEGKAHPDAPAKAQAVERVLRRLGAVPRGRAATGAALERALAAVADKSGEAPGRLADRIAALAAGTCREVPLCEDCAVRRLCPHPERSPTIKELPEDQRPRERLVRSGPEALTDAELLAIIIRDGTTKDSAVAVAQKLLARFGGVRGLADRSVKELCAADGVGPAKAAQTLAALSLARRLGAERLDKGESFRSSRQVFEHFFPRLRSERQERFLSVMLDAKNRIIRDVEISTGTLGGALVDPRDVFRHALVESAAALIFVHNHPSGDPAPSNEDVALTKRLVKAGELMGVRVLDHVIVGEEGYVSLADEGKMR